MRSQCTVGMLSAVQSQIYAPSLIYVPSHTHPLIYMPMPSRCTDCTVGMLSAMKQILKNEGINGFFKGLPLIMVRLRSTNTPSYLSDASLMPINRPSHNSSFFKGLPLIMVRPTNTPSYLPQTYLIPT